MSTAENIRTFSGEAGSTVPIYRFVALASDGQYDPVGSAEALAEGVSAQAGVANETIAIADINAGGIMKVEAGAAVSVGDLVSSDNVGRAKTAAAAGAGNHVLGKARTAAGVAGDIIEVHLIGPYLNAAS